MSKATLSFNLPEDKEDFELALRGGEMHCVIWDIMQFLRQKIKYDSDLSEDEIKAYEHAREKIVEFLKDRGLEENF